MDGVENPERRTFLGRMMAGALGLLGAASAFGAAGFLYPIRQARQGPIFTCFASQVAPGSSLTIKDLRGREVFLIRSPDGEFKAIGTVCSHLGCTVFYRPKKVCFECPCHNGVFDGEGNPVSGPPQRPLERFPVVVRDGKVFVDFS